MNIGVSVAVAAVFTWLGMVLAISFLEAPLKFRAPGVTLQVGLSIGRLVFRALNACEAILAATIAVALSAAEPSRCVVAVFAVAVLALVVQLAAVRPKLTQRSNAVLAAPDQAPGSRSRVHYVYVGLELVKVIALIATGVLLLAG